MQVGKKIIHHHRNIFFGVGRKKKIFYTNFQTFSFVHTRRVDGLTKYDLIRNLVFNEMHWKRGTNLKSFTTSIFSGWRRKKKNKLSSLCTCESY